MDKLKRYLVPSCMVAGASLAGIAFGEATLYLINLIYSFM